MEIAVLGSNGTYPTASRPTSGYLVRQGQTSIWMDAGFGTFMALCAELEPGDIDAIFLSHSHLDHCIDLLAYHRYQKYGPKRRVGIPVYVPVGLDGLFEGIVFGSQQPFGETFDFRLVGPGAPVKIGEIDLTFARTNHPVPTNAVRMEADGRSFVYTADTGESEAVTELATGVDVLLSEAGLQGSAAEKEYAHHLTAEEAGKMATQANASRLVLTHLGPSFDRDRSVSEAEAHFEGTVSLALPGIRIQI